jgi:hypothetical protein
LLGIQTKRSAAFSLTFVLALISNLRPLLAGESQTPPIPDDLVVDVRLFEARSVQPDYRAMRELSFFIATDGSTVTDPQWLATLARKVPDSYLATLAFERLPASGPEARFSHEKRTRRLELRVDLSKFSREEAFPAEVSGRLLRGEEEQRSFSRPLELRLGETYVVSGDDFELSASEYISHFRDYEDGEHRGLLYEALRDFSIFLVMTLTPRLDDASESPRDEAAARVELPAGAEVPEFLSPLPVTLVGTVELELDLDASGKPEQARVRRSSVPEVNPRVLGEAPNWRFERAAGRRVRLMLDVRAEP